MRLPVRTLLVSCLCAVAAWGLAPAPAWAWSGHALVSHQALASLPQLSGVSVKAEPLETFLLAQGAALEGVLAQQEAWARANVQAYAPRPDELAFRAAGASGQELRLRFLRALRLNELSHLNLFVQAMPGAIATRPSMPWVDITALASGVGARRNQYSLLQPGELVSALDVVASASAEPDYGLDIGLFADNGTAQGRRYGFGTQPFGSPSVDYSSQAPFHMGFYHEARIVYAAAGFLRRTQPEARMALFSALARHAFATGHAYWGWRFTGWAMHYVQDLTQPYHSRVLPAVSVARGMAINILAMAGFQEPKLHAIRLVSNRHAVVESYQFRRMEVAYTEGLRDDPLMRALADTRADARHPRLTVSGLRDRVSREAADAADDLDRQLERSFPTRFTSDPRVVLGMTTDADDLPRVARAHSALEHVRLESLVARRLGRAGVHSRALVREILGVDEVASPSPK